MSSASCRRALALICIASIIGVLCFSASVAQAGSITETERTFLDKDDPPKESDDWRDDWRDHRYEREDDDDDGGDDPPSRQSPRPEQRKFPVRI